MERDFKTRLDELDLSLFFAIPTQSLDDDRRSWIAVQRSIRADGYAYLEIGSYLGGSIQQHLVDAACTSITSIDRRPFVAPDDRGHAIEYEENSTELMLEKLKRIDAAASRKITTFECDASVIDRSKLPAVPDYCFIDGEHTRSAVLSDFTFCLEICAPNAAICLHDARIIHRGIKDALELLASRNIKFAAGRLPGDTFGIFLNDCRAQFDPFLAAYLGNETAFFTRMQARQFFKKLVPKSAHVALRKLFPAP
jgi:hypothetical protein